MKSKYKEDFKNQGVRSYDGTFWRLFTPNPEMRFEENGAHTFLQKPSRGKSF